MAIKSGIHFNEDRVQAIIDLLAATHGLEPVHLYAQWVGLPYAFCDSCDEQMPFISAGHDPNQLQGPCVCYVCGSVENL